MTTLLEKPAEAPVVDDEADIVDDKEKVIRPGTAGWTVDDFADASYGWNASPKKYEIIDGILLVMPPPGDSTGSPPSDLHTALARLVPPLTYRFKEEVDLLLIEPDRVVSPDLAIYTNEAVERQRQIVQERGLADLPAQYRPMYVMPELVVESVSKGHVRHDRVTKRRWYAEAGIPHYWILDHADSSIDVFVLDGKTYRRQQRVAKPGKVASDALGGVEVDLTHVFPD